MSEFFSTTEQFLKFKTNWTNSVHSPKAKSIMEPCDEYRYDIPKHTVIEGWERAPYGYMCTRKGTGKRKISGWINAEHHLLYNLFRNKPLHTGFSPIRCERKMNTYTSNMHNFYEFVRTLRTRVIEAQRLVKYNDKKKFYNQKNGFLNKISAAFISDRVKKQDPDDLTAWQLEQYREHTHALLAPFKGSITLEMLARVDDDRLKMVTMFDSHKRANYWLGLS